VAVGHRALALLLGAAVMACDDPPPPSACPADGYPASSARPAGCAPGPDWLAYAFTRDGTASPALFIGRPDGSCTQRVTTDGAFYGGPAFFPGGRKLVYASTRSGLNQLYLLDLESGLETWLETPSPFSPDWGQMTAAAPAVSPDGATIAFEGSLTASAGWSDVFTVPAAGGNVLRVTQDPAAATLPRWSVDGTSIYYLSYQAGAAEIRTIRPDGTADAPVTTGSSLSSRFDLSPNGQSLLYARHSTTGAGPMPTELVAFDLATSAVRVISAANEADPAVDGAGTSVAVSRRNAAGGYDLFLLDQATGAVKRQLTSCPGQAFGATFSR
jgi:TolB protein